MRTKLTLALFACAAFAASPPVLAQPKDTKESSAKTEQKKAGLAGQDRKYFQEMAQANMAEIQTGKLAQQKAASDEVKDFARQMVEDHTKLLQEQRSMAKAKNVSLPKEPEKEHQSALKKMQDLSGAEFDRAYMQQMVKDHQQTLKVLQDAQKNAKDPQLKQAAEKAAPHVEKHLETAKQITAKLSK